MSFHSSGEFIDKLNKLFNAFIALPLLLVGFGYLEIYSGSYAGLTTFSSPYLTGIVILALVGSMLGLSRNFKVNVNRISSDQSIKERVEVYFIAAKQFYVRVFGLSALATLLLYIFGETVYAVAYAFILFVLSVYRPSLATIASQLGLKGQDRKDFLEKKNYTDYAG